VRSFEKFHLEPHRRCQFDAVSVYNGELLNYRQLIGRYCGTAIPADIISSGSSIVVNFVTDSSRTGEGFFARYTSVYGKLPSLPLHNIKLKLKVKLNKALDENSFLSYGASPAIRDHTVLPATRHK